jgi:hypothetical protein
LRDVQGLSNHKAADALDVSVSALKARLHHDRLARRICRRARVRWLKSGASESCSGIRLLAPATLGALYLQQVRIQDFLVRPHRCLGL